MINFFQTYRRFAGLSLLYPYLPGKYSDELQSIDQVVQIFTDSTPSMQRTQVSKYHHYVFIPLVRRMFHSDSFLQEMLQNQYATLIIRIIISLSRVKIYLSEICS